MVRLTATLDGTPYQYGRRSSTPELVPITWTKPSYAPPERPKPVIVTVTVAEVRGWSVRLCAETVTVGCFPKPSSATAVRLPGGTGPEGASRPVTEMVNVSGPVPILEMVSIRDCCTSAAPEPNAMDEGASADVARIAALMSSDPAPDCCTRDGTSRVREIGAAVLTSSDR